MSDVKIETFGGVLSLITPLNPTGRNWVTDHVRVVSDLSVGGSFVVAALDAVRLIGGMKSDGLAVELRETNEFQ